MSNRFLTDEPDALREERDRMREDAKSKRHGCISVWLVLIILVNSINAFKTFSMLGDLSEAPGLIKFIVVTAAIMGVVNVIGAVMLFAWKRMGFWLIVATSVICIILNIILMANYDVEGPEAIRTLSSSIIGPLVLFGILQISGAGGESCWKHLE